MQSDNSFQFSGFEAMLKGLNVYEDETLLGLIKDRCGVDLKHPKRDYSLNVSKSIVTVVREFYFPNLSELEGRVELGRAIARGYNKTIIGQVQSAPIKLVTPERALQILVKMLNTNANFGQRALVKTDEQNYILEFRDDYGDPAIAEGIVKQFVEILNLAQATVEAHIKNNRDFDIKISW